MRTSDVLKAFNEDKTAVAEAVGISASAVYQWEEFVPPASAIVLRELRPDIPFDPSVYKDWEKPRGNGKRKAKRRH